MLEILNAPYGKRYGEARMNSSTAYRGSFCYLSGFNSSGDPLLALPYNSAQAARAVYPVNKMYFPDDFNDTAPALDLIKKGDTCVYYGEGEFISDKWSPLSFGFTSGYWAGVQGVSSSFGYRINIPGGVTAEATQARQFAWVATGAARADCKAGYLVGTSVGVFTGTGVTSDGRLGWVAQVLAFYYSSSADAKIRFRVGMPKYRA